MSNPEERDRKRLEIVEWVTANQGSSLSDAESKQLDALLDDYEELYFEFGCNCAGPV
jgi:hypothetical protein